MATFIPSLDTLRDHLEPDLRQLAERLDECLEDESLCWFDLPPDDRELHADFIVLHPERGLLFLDVCDWQADDLRRIDRMGLEVLTPRGQLTLANPLERLRQHMQVLAQRFVHDAMLRSEHGDPCLPLGYGVVLTRMPRAACSSSEMAEALPPHRVICRDEIAGREDSRSFRARLWGMMSGPPGTLPLIPEQIDRIRWYLFPEIRLPRHRQHELLAGGPDDFPPPF